LLYPDRPLPGFLAKNQIDEAKLNSVPLLTQMLAANDRRLVEKDASGCYRFNASFTNASDLKAKLESLRDDYGDAIDTARQSLLELYESVFRHNAFTGRSGTMFGFEGLGSIYWHMVSKLLLAVQENYFTALDDDTDDATRQQLGQMYYRVREGIGFNKTPEEYGAFPTDPYSHTPKHHGAKQPGMTGQVKEEILTRFGELGVRVNNGSATFLPSLLRAQEFLTDPRELRYVDVDGNWQTIAVPSNGLAFTWCQVPVVYQIDDEAPISLTITEQDGSEENWPQLVLPADKSAELFKRSGTIRRLTLNLHSSMLFTE